MRRGTTGHIDGECVPPGGREHDARMRSLCVDACSAAARVKWSGREGTSDASLPRQIQLRSVHRQPVPDWTTGINLSVGYVLKDPRPLRVQPVVDQMD